MKIGIKHLLATTAAAAAIAPVASAQSQDNPFLRGRYTSVTERQQPEYDPEVIHVGSFNLASSVTAGVETNDNVFFQQTGKEDDVIARIAPAAEFRSTWSVHQLTAGITAERAEYADHASESTTDYNLYLRGRLDVQRNFRLTAAIDGGHDTEARYEPASQNAPEPAQNDTVGASVGGQFRTDRLMFDAQVGARVNEYADFFDYRDNSEVYLASRVSYAISPDIAVFVQARNANTTYDFSDTRDVKQLSVQAGVSFELAAPFEGEVSVGTVHNDKKLDTERDTDALSLSARVRWFPTQLTTVTFTGNAGISDPGVLQATSAEYRRFSIRADHELFRNLLLYGQFGFGSADYEASAAQPTFVRSDESRDVRAGMVYKLNKHAQLDLGYRLNSQKTTGTLPQDVDGNVFSASIKVFP